MFRLIQGGMYDRQQPVLCSAVGMGVSLEFRVRKLSLTKKLAVILRTGNHTRGPRYLNMHIGSGHILCKTFSFSTMLNFKRQSLGSGWKKLYAVYVLETISLTGKVNVYCLTKVTKCDSRMYYIGMIL